MQRKDGRSAFSKAAKLLRVGRSLTSEAAIRLSWDQIGVRFGGLDGTHCLGQPRERFSGGARDL